MSNGESEIMLHKQGKSYVRVYAYASDIKKGAYPANWQWTPGMNPLFLHLKTPSANSAMRALCGLGFSFGS